MYIAAILMRRARHVRWNILIYGQGEKEFILLGQVILHIRHGGRS